jgi:uncharacterized membrane protein HdeD (DUF308 family)
MLGSIALTSVFWATMVSIILFGTLLVAAGSATVLHSLLIADWKGFFVELIAGILSSVVGWMIIMNPILGATTLTIVLGVYFTVSGLIKISGGLLNNLEHWGWLLFNGIASSALGLMILAQWPAASLWVLGMFLAIDLMVSGWTAIMLSLAVRRICKLKDQETA